MSKLIDLINDDKLMDYLEDSGLHDWGCASWSEGQHCCLQLPHILNILKELAKEDES